MHVNRNVNGENERGTGGRHITTVPPGTLSDFPRTSLTAHN